MARAYQTTDKSQQDNLAKPDQKNDGKLRNFALVKFNIQGQVVTPEIPTATFLLNPATYEETKSNNWSPQNVPGQSDPVYQWISGGPRVVTFEALVTRDSIHLDKTSPSFGEQLAGAALNVVGDIASSFAGVALPPIGSLFPTPSDEDGTQLSIADKIEYYRSLLYPTYSTEYASLAASPPLVVMFAGKTFRGSLSPVSGPEGPNSTDYVPVWFVQNLNIRITKQLPNLDPMEAKVTFTLHEYPVKPLSIGNFAATSAVAAPSGSSILGNIGNALGGVFNG